MNAVLGPYPAYVNLAVKLGASFFSMPASRWRGMNLARQWAVNRNFLDQEIGAGSQFVFARHPHYARLGTWFHREIQYLRSRGITIVPTLDAYVP